MLGDLEGMLGKHGGGKGHSLTVADTATKAEAGNHFKFLTVSEHDVLRAYPILRHDPKLRQFIWLPQMHHCASPPLLPLRHPGFTFSFSFLKKFCSSLPLGNMQRVWSSVGVLSLWVLRSPLMPAALLMVATAAAGRCLCSGGG